MTTTDNNQKNQQLLASPEGRAEVKRTLALAKAVAKRYREFTRARNAIRKQMKLAESEEISSAEYSADIDALVGKRREASEALAQALTDLARQATVHNPELS